MKKLIVFSLSLLLPFSLLLSQELHHDCAHHRIERWSGYKETGSQPRTFVGANYDILWHRCYWDINPAVKEIHGHVTSFFRAMQPGITQIDFELHTSLTVDSVLHSSGALSFTHSNHVLSITLPTALTLNQTDSLTIYYGGAPVSSGGFGAFEQGMQGGHPVIWTLSEPYGAKFWWPCKNDLSDKIDSIDIIVRTPAGMRAAANGVLLSTATGPSHTTYHWQHRHPIATYLVAIAVTRYALFEQSISIAGGGSFPVMNFIYPGDSAAAATALDDFIPVYSLFDSLFGPYPFQNEKYGHAQFSWGGGMEHQTMTFMGNWNWDILVHEYAHQWFGNYITCGSWHDIWLNEGFATYLTGLAYEHLAPSFWYSWKLATMNHVTGQPDGSVYVDDTTSVWRVFNSRLSYSKGAMVLHMLRHVMGDQAFYNGVRSYLADPFLAHGYAMTDDLKAHLETACGCSLTQFFDDWVYGEGYPMYDIHVEHHPPATYHLTINQTTSHPSVAFFAMPLPLRFYGSSKDTTVLLDHQSQGQSFWVEPGFEADSVVFDPEKWVVSRDNMLTLGISSKPALSFSIYPNPAYDQLYISKPQNLNARWSISSLQGRLLLQGDRLEENIDIRSLSPGMYLFHIYHESGVLSQKFIRL